MELLMGSGQNQAESGGSSSTESSSLSGGLRFGQKIYFEDGSGSGAGTSGSTSKNCGRKLMTARCQVEGCRMDLSNVKAYYSRHKVCCIHSKSSKVIVSGLHQRFCQQCSRFHQLSEFDLEKRSCRRRLACHNERRRKPQPTLFTSRYARLAPSLYGNPSSAMIRSILGDSRSVIRRSGSASSWQFNPERESYHPLMNVLSQGSTGFTITYPEMMNNTTSTDSSCALSLLSNSNPNQQPQQQFQSPTNIWRPSSGFDSVIAERVTMAQPSPGSVHNQYLNPTWEFLAGEKSNSHYMSPVLEQSQISDSEPVDFQISNGTAMGGFELSLHQQVLREYMEPENTRDYNSSPQYFNWSL